MFFRQFLAALALLAAALPALAAPLSERSPFTQGHWWNPQRAGSGFEIFSVGSDAMAIWYTYDASGAPIWYTAQGTLGSTAAWPLLRHQWVNGQRGAFATAGSLRLTVRNAEAMKVDFEIAGSTGSWEIQPFVQSGLGLEVDHSGSYFNPDNSGWGLTLTQQGDVLGGVLYTYDASGRPTWYAGFDRNVTANSVNFISARGSCPTCLYTASSTQSVGRVTFDFVDEARLVIRNQLSVPMASGINVDGARLVQLGRPASSRPADRGLATFESQAQLRGYIEAGMLAMPPSFSGIDFSPAPAAATSFSTTNLQEAGVDEADLLKTDGRRIYTFATNLGSRLPQIRVAQVTGEGQSMEVVGTVPLSDAATLTYSSLSSAGLYVHGTSLVAVTGTGASSYTVPLWCYPTAWVRGETRVEIFDVPASGLPTSAFRAVVDGHVIASRRIGDRLYVISRFAPNVNNFMYGATDATRVAANQQLLAATPYASLVPNVRLNGGAAEPLIAATAMHLPPLGTRPTTADTISVYAIDIPSRRIVQALGILASSDAAYVSPENLYIATSRYQIRNTAGSLLPEPPFYTTDIHQVRLGATGMSVVAMGSTEGALDYNPDKAAFRMSEHQGKLRVVTTSNVMWGAGSKNRLTIFELSTAAPGQLRIASILPNAQRPDPIGKPGELLYSTRFAGDRLYAVTFKKVDPLYVIDVANPSDPKVAGALEIPGFSEYLHPLPNGLLLGFGKDTMPSSTSGDGQFAWYQGLQLTLFDVSNAGNPRELQRVLIGKRGSDSPLLRDHHAFSSLTRSDGSLAIAIPARIHDGSTTPLNVWDTFPFAESGLTRFALTGSTPADVRLTQLPSLVTHTATPGSSPYSYPPEAMAYDARSVLFRDGTVYVSAGKYWFLDNATGRVSGPF